MSLQEAYLIWVGTQEMVLKQDLMTQTGFRVRNRAWDIYCAIRDGHPPNHYHDRRVRFGNPLVSDAEVKRFETKKKLAH